MSSEPKFYRLDLVNLGELFDPDVPFSEWCKKCQSAGDDGFGTNRLQDLAPDLTPLEHTERICGTLLYINLSGAGIVWLSLALICYCCGWYHPARSFAMYTLMPIGIWLVIYILYDRSKDSRYGIHHKNQHKYLHLKYVWPVELHPSAKREGPLIFCIVPHGVIPLGIDYAMFDKLGAGRCNWVAAPVLFKLPFFRSYLERVGAMPANAANIRAALARNENVAGGSGLLCVCCESHYTLCYTPYLFIADTRHNYPTRLETRTKEFNWIASRRDILHSRISYIISRRSESNLVPTIAYVR